MHFVSSEYYSEKSNTTYFIPKSTNYVLFFENRVVCGSSLHEIEMCYGCGFFLLKIYCILKKWRDDPEITSYFSV